VCLDDVEYRKDVPVDDNSSHIDNLSEIKERAGINSQLGVVKYDFFFKEYSHQEYEEAGQKRQSSIYGRKWFRERRRVSSMVLRRGYLRQY
jgi:hypothetical protein